ncbi:MAG: LemA family protein [Muribaculaceae bacterium]|nr:LemA family protein [Muribaculaceae bacterium]
MKKGTIIWIVVAFLLLSLCFTGCSKYNTLVDRQTLVEQAWSNVETQYQRRSDLIPNLVETVKGYAGHESSTLQNVTEARARVGSVTISIDSLNEQSMARFTRAQGELQGALKSLLSVTEAYPDLKANENFNKLQDELAGTENRIAVARKDYNEVAREYNAAVRRFPTNIFASFFGFSVKPYFSADEGASTAPVVKF